MYLTRFIVSVIILFWGSLLSAQDNALLGTQATVQDSSGEQTSVTTKALRKRSYTRCLNLGLEQDQQNKTIAALKKDCRQQTHSSSHSNRFEIEKQTQDLAYVLTPHRQNYVLAFTHNAYPNNEPWTGPNRYAEASPMKHSEAKLQISLKVPLLKEQLFKEDDGVYFGFTLKSFWQVYNPKISAPFRDSNYRPELFYQSPFEVPQLDGVLFFRAGIEHESNGRSQLLSRSWNRLFLGFGYVRNRWALYLQPWYRLPENNKIDDGDPATPLPAKGDDNPDITDFYGNFELITAYDHSHYQWTTMTRMNFDTHKGAFELGFSFPIHGRLRGFMQYFDGYGESMIDYNHRNQRVGIGILLTDVL